MTVPSSRRPVPVCGRTDLQAQQAEYGGQLCAVVKDPIALEYHRLSDVEFRLLKLLDGQRSLQSIQSELNKSTAEPPVDLDTIQKLILDLGEKNLVWNRRRKPSLSMLGSDRKTGLVRLLSLFQHIFFLRLPAWHADPLLKLLLPLARILFSRPMIAVSAVGIVLSWGMLLSHFEEFQRRLPSLESGITFREAAILWVTIGLAKFVHELGHGLSCMMLGGRCHGIGIAFLMFSPCLYCDVSDAWMLPRRRSRILIALAGIWVELMISALCLCVWWNSAPGLLHDLALQMFLVTSVSTILFNTNPLLKYDGYYILCDLLEIPNLQQQSQRAMAAIAQGILSGRSPRPDPTTAHLHRGWLALYGISSSLYKWSMVIGIGMFLHHLLEPAGLQSLSWCYIAMSLMTGVYAFLHMVWYVFNSPGWSRLMWIRSGVCWLVCLGTAAVIWYCPLPNRFTAPLIVEPLEVQHVYIESPGFLATLFVQPGTVVIAGDPIAELHNPDLEAGVLEADGRWRKSTVELQLAQAISDPDVGQLAKQTVQTALLQREEAVRQVERLAVRAPVGGRVISTSVLHHGPHEEAGKFIGDIGTALDDRHLGTALDRRFHLCSIAPSDDWQAVAWVRQSDCQFLEEQGEVGVKLEAFPGQSWHGKITRISPAGEKAIPEQLSSQFGGTLAAQRDSQGVSARETLYQVTIALEPAVPPLTTGLRGSARFERPQEHVGDWLLRTYYSTFLSR